MKIEHFAVAAITLALAGTAAGIGCPPVVDSVWQAAMQAAQVAIVDEIKNTLVEKVTGVQTDNMKREESEMKKLAAQTAASGEKVAATQRAANEAEAMVAAEISNRKAMFEAVMDFNPQTGQGFDPCGEQARSKNIATAIGEANTAMQEKVVSEIDNAPGRFVKSPGDVIGRRIAVATTTYCSPDQARAGFCSQPGRLAGKDTDAAHFFATNPAGTPESQAKSDMLNLMYGVPAAAPNQTVAQSPTGIAYLEAKRTNDAYRSISQASFKNLQAWTEARNGGGGERSDSVVDSIADKVNTYAGGNNYLAWEKSRAAQSERGLLVDLAKMRAFALYLKNLEYQQYERIEANLAAMLAMRARSEVPINYAQQSESRGKVK